MDIGPSSQRRETSRKRVLSPRAAKRGAEPCEFALALDLRLLDKVFLDYLYHDGPTTLVCRECLCPARKRDLIEPGLGDGQHDAVRHLLQSKLNERRWLGGIIKAAINRERMPPHREQPFGNHLLDGDFERHAYM